MVSEVHKYFHGNDCSIEGCNYKMSKKDKSGSTKLLWNHLEKKHRDVYEKTAKGKMNLVSNDVPAKKLKTSSSSIPYLFDPNTRKKKKNEVCSDITGFLVFHNLPFTLANSPFLRRIAVTNYGVNGNEMPNRHDIRAEISPMAQNSIDGFIRK